ncbi:Uncharacterised protein [Yersinia mollaretii]|nr:Uncharacterised protein [Yersinia mollaretii]
MLFCISTVPVNAVPVVLAKLKVLVAASIFSRPLPVRALANSAIASRFKVALVISTVTSLPTPLVLVRVTLLLSATCNTPSPVTLLAKVPLKPLSAKISCAPASAIVAAAPRLVVEATVSLLLSASAYWPEKPLLSPVSDTFAPLLISTVEFATPLSALAIAPLSPLSTRCEVALSRFTVAVEAPRLLASVTVSAPAAPIW